MSSLLLDTHVFAWTLAGAPMQDTIRKAIVEAEAVYVSPISFYEIGQKVRIGKWPEMVPYIGDLPDLLHRIGGLVATLTPEVCLLAATAVWPHRDPFDRMLAATSIIAGLTLVSIDPAFDSFDHQGRRIHRIG